MPLYEYQCEQCGEKFEAMQKFADEPLKIHEKCGGPVHRLLSAPALQFKGSGWYVNDYAKSGASSSSSGSAATPSSGSKSESGSTASNSSSSNSSSSTSSTSGSSSESKS